MPLSSVSLVRVLTIIGFAMQNEVLEVKNIILPHSILGRLPSEMASGSGK
jgi:hypothetical protein